MTPSLAVAAPYSEPMWLNQRYHPRVHDYPYLTTTTMAKKVRNINKNEWKCLLIIIPRNHGLRKRIIMTRSRRIFTSHDVEINFELGTLIVIFILTSKGE